MGKTTLKGGKSGQYEAGSLTMKKEKRLEDSISHKEKM